MSLLLTATAILLIGLIREQGLPRGAALTLAHLALTALAAVLTAAILSGGSPLWLFHKVFLDAGQTQFWFFGGFSGNDRLLNLRNVVGMIAPDWHYSVSWAVLAAVAGFAYVRAGTGSRRADTIGLICGAQLISGFASQAAGHFSFYYLASFSNSAQLVALALLIPPALRLRVDPGKVLAGVAIAGIGVIVLGAAFLFSSHGQKARQALSAQIGPHAHVAFAEAGMNFPATTAGEIQFLRGQRAAMDHAGIPTERRIISSYYNWADVTLGARQETHFNSIIQLMSDADRAEFTQYLVRHDPELVATLDPAATPWAMWNLRASWSFYRAALAGHEPAWRGSSMLYWKRRSAPFSPAVDNLPSCTPVQRSPRAIDLRFAGGDTGTGPVLLDVALAYSALPGAPGLNGDLGRGYLRLTDRSPVLLASIPAGTTLPDEIQGNPGLRYGLPSGTQQWNIPVEHRAGDTSVVQLDTQGGARASLTVTSCKVVGAWPDPFTSLDRLPRLAPPMKL